MHRRTSLNPKCAAAWPSISIGGVPYTLNSGGVLVCRRKGPRLGLRQGPRQMPRQGPRQGPDRGPDMGPDRGSDRGPRQRSWTEVQTGGLDKGITQGPYTGGLHGACTGALHRGLAQGLTMNWGDGAMGYGEETSRLPAMPEKPLRGGVSRSVKKRRRARYNRLPAVPERPLRGGGRGVKRRREKDRELSGCRLAGSGAAVRRGCPAIDLFRLSTKRQ
jgi:hypothetical protein